MDQALLLVRQLAGRPGAGKSMKLRLGDFVTHVLEYNVEKEVVKLLVTVYKPSQRINAFSTAAADEFLVFDLGHTRRWLSLNLQIQGGALIVDILDIWQVIAHTKKNR